MNSSLVNSLNESKKIAIITHTTPDADALCSSFALKNILRNNFDYKAVDVFADGEIGSLYDPILRDEVLNRTPFNSYDMVFVLDCPTISRTGKYAEIIEKTPIVVNIDHHATNERFGTGSLNFVSTNSSSTCEIIYLIAKASQYEMSNVIAKELYQGIITDTNCFTSNSLTQRTHQVVSDLLKYNFDSEAIKAYYFKNNSIAKTRLIQQAFKSMSFYNDRFTTMKIPNNLFVKFDASFEDTLGIIDNGINISGIEVSAILIEAEPEKIYVSLRSKGKIDVGEIAERFGGGGNATMAAFQRQGNIKELESELVQSIKPQLGEIEVEENGLF